MANHTVVHACPAATFDVDPRYPTEAYPRASMLREIEQQNVLLTAIDGRPEHGFGTPCGNGTAGGSDYIRPLFDGGSVSYICTGDASSSDAQTVARDIDIMHIPARSFRAYVTGEHPIVYARQAQAGGGMAVYVFHGVAGDYLSVSREAYRVLLT